jgi:hypothetical protein
MVGFMMVVLVGDKSMKKSNKPNTTQYARAGEVQVNCIWILVLVAMSGHTSSLGLLAVSELCVHSTLSACSL